MQGVQRPTKVTELPTGPVEYRLEPGHGPVILIFHGGHMRAGLALGEDVFAEAGYAVLVPSRPGYGRTPLAAGPSPAAYADTIGTLCQTLGITTIAAVVGISGGGPTAVAMAARHPDLVERLLLISAVSALPWPDRLTRVGAHIGFAPHVEALTWAAIRLLVGQSRPWPLRLLPPSFSLLPARRFVGAVTAGEQDVLRTLCKTMRSGSGFVNDLRRSPDLTSAVGQPTLIIASRNDRGVPFTHAESLRTGIHRATLVESRAAGHFVWFSSDWPTVAERIRKFLTSPT